MLLGVFDGRFLHGIARFPTVLSTTTTSSWNISDDPSKADAIVHILSFRHRLRDIIPGIANERTVHYKRDGNPSSPTSSAVRPTPAAPFLLFCSINETSRDIFHYVPLIPLQTPLTSTNTTSRSPSPPQPNHWLDGTAQQPAPQ